MAWVREPSNLVSIGIKDFNGKTARTQFWVMQAADDPASGAPAALAAAVQGISAGGVTNVQLLSRAVQNAPATPTTGPYDSVSDKLKLEFACADGSKLVLQIPAPLATVLTTGNYKADSADTLLDGLVQAMKTNAKSAEGATIVALSNGYRRMPPRLKRR